MLLRLVSHARKGNPHLIDELISILGLPDDLVFRMKDGRRYLKDPWQVDPEVNIPVSIREHCEPVEISEDLPVEKNEVTGVMQRPIDTRKILGLKLVLDNNPGKEMWEQIERIMDHGTPRDKKVPVPAIVAPNQKDAFFLEAKDIPICDLRPPSLATTTTATMSSLAEVQVSVEPVKVQPIKPTLFECGVCQKAFTAQRGLWMHERKTRHKVKEPVAA